MSPQVERPEPVYVQIVKAIRSQIMNGELRDGDHVPSVRELMREWQIALATAHKVLAGLKSEGLVRTIPGNGTVVSASEAMKQTPKDRIGAIRATGRIYPPGERAEIRSATMVDAPETVAGALGLEPGSRVIRRHRVTYRDDVPVSASVSWFSGELAKVAPRLLETDRIVQGTFGYIEERTGRVGVAGRDQLAADRASDQDAEDLGVEAGTPVLRGRNTLMDVEGGVIEYGESAAVPDRFVTYEYEIMERP